MTDDRTITTLVFSRDRALQLDAGLRSIQRQAADISTTTLTVLYRASTPRHAAQYRELARAVGNGATFVEEVNFRQQVLAEVRSSEHAAPARRTRSLPNLLPSRFSKHGDQSAARRCLLFLVDDTLFFRAFQLLPLCGVLLRDRQALGVSLRLGRNTIYSYVQNAPQPLPNFTNTADGVLTYDWTKAAGDFAYPLEVSSSIYRTSTVLQLLPKLPFDDPNSLESQLSLQASRFRRSHPHLLCCERSVAFSVPLNRVQSVFENRVGKDPGMSVEALADHFDRGERIDLKALDGFLPSACHQEIDLQFARNGVVIGGA